jgi:hypothetical protein
VVILFADYQLLDQDLSGDFSVDSPTFVVDSASNNIGVGVSSPSYPMTIASASNAVGLAINGRSADGLGAAYWFANNGTTQHGDIRASASEFRISSTPASAVQTFYTNGSERLRILSSGGITFNGDTAAANALDDYEEGTWTPTSLVNGFTVSLSNFNAARYVKIGKIVHVTFDMVFGSATYASSFSHVGGLPFGSATSAVNGFYSSGTISGNAAGGPIYIGSGTTSVYLFQGINSNTTTTWNAGFTYETT